MLNKFIAISALVVVGAASMVNFARAAVAFNTFPISFTSETNKDLPLIDAKNVTDNGSYSTSQDDHDNGVQADPGETVRVQIYYHNTGVPEDIATNVIIKANLPGGARQTHEISATIDSDQTEPISSEPLVRGGNIKINVSGSQPQTLTLIPGSARHFPNRTTTGQTLSNPDNVTTSGVNIGSVQGCFEFSGFVTFDLRLGQQQAPTRELSITKGVLNVSRSHTAFLTSAPASPGERVRFEIKVQTSGTASQTNVIVRDILPSQFLIYAPDSLKIDGTQITNNQLDIFGSGISLGASVNSGTTRTIVFDATVAAATAFNSSNLTQTNTANVRSDEVGVRQATAQVNAQLPGAQFALRKTAFNNTQGVDATTVIANPGDLITYTLFYKNTGGVEIKGAVIEDDIKDVLELGEISSMGNAIALDNGVIKFGTADVAAGVEISRNFQIRVRPASQFPATSDLVMTNVFGNETKVAVRKPTVAGVITPPRTGASEWVTFALATIFTAGVWVYRRRKSIA